MRKAVGLTDRSPFSKHKRGPSLLRGAEARGVWAILRGGHLSWVQRGALDESLRNAAWPCWYFREATRGTSERMDRWWIWCPRDQPVRRHLAALQSLN